MEIIVPYDKMLFENGGGFITPEGKIIYTYNSHERYAEEYLCGDHYRYLTDIKYRDCELDSNYLKEKFGFEGDINDIDEYISSPLSPEALKILKRWIELHGWSPNNNPYSDFMVHILGFDKVETVMHTRITTTSRQPHIRFFNYLLMDWNVVCRNPMRYIPEEDDFDYISEDQTNIWLTKDYKAEREIKDLKAKVLYKDRPLFFRDKID